MHIRQYLNKVIAMHTSPYIATPSFSLSSIADLFYRMAANIKEATTTIVKPTYINFRMKPFYKVEGTRVTDTVLLLTDFNFDRIHYAVKENIKAQ